MHIGHLYFEQTTLVVAVGNNKVSTVALAAENAAAMRRPAGAAERRLWTVASWEESDCWRCSGNGLKVLG